MSAETTALKLRPLLLATLAVAAVAAGLAAGIWPTWKLAGSRGLAGLAGGLAATAVGLAAGLLVMLPRAARGRQALAMGFLMASPVRLAVTIVLAMLLYWLTPWGGRTLVLWSAIWYLLLLTVEVVWLANILNPGVTPKTND
ncbi:MAG: hypothetical protein BIFFINMI_00121 [Phycisphaerae bacterium]|nr:hypothetical protein [Phycisphaerae bacterium]